jgi:hypothetical protein
MTAGARAPSPYCLAARVNSCPLGFTNRLRYYCSLLGTPDEIQRFFRGAHAAILCFLEDRKPAQI